MRIVSAWRIAWLGAILIAAGAGIVSAQISQAPRTSLPAVVWRAVPHLITRPGDTRLGRDERIIACAIPLVQRIWLDSGRPRLYWAFGQYYFWPRVSTPPNTVPDHTATGPLAWGPVVHGVDGDIVLTPAMVQSACPYLSAPWWGLPGSS